MMVYTHCITVVGLNADAYQSLRSQVQRLKTEHKQVLGARQVARQARLAVLDSTINLTEQMESMSCCCHFVKLVLVLQLENLTNLQHQNEAHVQEQAHLDKVAKLQISLHESKEHCGKLRQQYERYFFCKKSVETQAESVTHIWAAFKRGIHLS